MPSDETNLTRQVPVPVPIGQLIQQELRDQNQSVNWLSQQLNCDRRNVYDIFTRAYIDTGLLYRISLVLGKDFFKPYSEALKVAEKQSVTPPPRKEPASPDLETQLIDAILRLTAMTSAPNADTPTTLIPGPETAPDNPSEKHKTKKSTKKFGRNKKNT